MSTSNDHKTVGGESGSHIDGIELYTDDDDDGDSNDASKGVLMTEDRRRTQRPSSARSGKSKSSLTRRSRSNRSMESNTTNTTTEEEEFNILETAEAVTLLNPLIENRRKREAVDDCCMTEDVQRTLATGSVEMKTMADRKQSSGRQSQPSTRKNHQTKNRQTMWEKRKSDKSAESEKTELEVASEDIGQVDEKVDEERTGTALPVNKSCMKSARKKRRRKSSASNVRVASRSTTKTERRRAASPEFQLGTSDNPEVKSWLRKKNRILRKQQAEERRREKQQKKEEEERKKLSEMRNRESAEKVAEWMRQKKIQQQEQESKLAVQMSPNNSISGSTNVEKIAAAINSTLDQSTTVRPIEVSVTNRSTPRSNRSPGGANRLPGRSPGGATDSQIIDAAVSKSIASLSATNRSRADAGYVPSPRQCVSPAMITLPQDDRYPTNQLARSLNDQLTRSRSLPVNSATTPKTQRAANRISYEAWLQRKQTDDELKRRRRAEEELQRQTTRDKSADEIVSNVARRRIDAILSGRRRVDTGIGKVDNEANSYPRIRSAVMTARSDDRLLTRRGSSRDQTDSLPLSTVDLNVDLNVERDDTDTNSHRPKELENSLTQTKIAIQPSLSAVSMTSSFIDSSVPSGSTTTRPWSAFPARHLPRRTATSGPERPSTADSVRHRQRGLQGVTTSADRSSPTGTLDLSPTVSRLHAVAPRPSLPVTESSAYRSVRYQQKSWNGFADSVWDQVTESEGGEMAQTPYRSSIAVTPSVADSSRPMKTTNTGQGAQRPLATFIGTMNLARLKTKQGTLLQETERDESTIRDITDSSQNIVNTSGSYAVEDVDALAAATNTELTSEEGLLVEEHRAESLTTLSVNSTEPLSREQRHLLMAQKIRQRRSDRQRQSSMTSGELDMTSRHVIDNEKSSPESCVIDLEEKDENANIVMNLKTDVQPGNEIDGEHLTRSGSSTAKHVSFREMTMTTTSSDDDIRQKNKREIIVVHRPTTALSLASRQPNEDDQLSALITSNDVGTPATVAAVTDSVDNEAEVKVAVDDIDVRSSPIIDEHHRDKTVYDDDVTSNVDDVDDVSECIEPSTSTPHFIPSITLNDGSPEDDLDVNNQ